MSPEIEAFLTAAGLSFKVHRHAPVISFADARAALPFDPLASVKAIAFRRVDGSYAIVGMRATDRADYKKIADALGVRRAELKAAEATDLLRDLHMEPGGVVPLPIGGATVVIDHRVLDLDVIFCGTGRMDATLEIASRDLIQAAGGQTKDVVKAGDPAG